MVWLRRTTHYLFIVVVAVNSTLLTINAGDYIFYTDWAWTSFVVFSISQSTMLVVGAIYYMLFTGVPGTATYYATIMTIYTWIAKGAWFALGYPYDFVVVPVWIPSAMLLDLAYWATRRNKHAAILIGGVLVGMSLPLFNMINLLLVADPLEMAFKYPRPTLPPYMTPIEPQVGKFYNSPVALGAGAGAGNVAEAVNHIKKMNKEIRLLKAAYLDNDYQEIIKLARECRVSMEVALEVGRLGRLPIVNFAAGGITTPADASFLMNLGCDGVFVGSGIFKSADPSSRAKAIVLATTFYDDEKKVLEAQKMVDERKSLIGLDTKNLDLRMQERGPSV